MPNLVVYTFGLQLCTSLTKNRNIKVFNCRLLGIPVCNKIIHKEILINSSFFYFTLKNYEFECIHYERQKKRSADFYQVKNQLAYMYTIFCWRKTIIVSTIIENKLVSYINRLPKSWRHKVGGAKPAILNLFSFGPHTYVCCVTRVAIFLDNVLYLGHPFKIS